VRIPANSKALATIGGGPRGLCNAAYDTLNHPVSAAKSQLIDTLTWALFHHSSATLKGLGD